MIKVVGAERGLLRVLDRGDFRRMAAMGVSQDTFSGRGLGGGRVRYGLRMGPDEVHLESIAKWELKTGTEPCGMEQSGCPRDDKKGLFVILRDRAYFQGPSQTGPVRGAVQG